MNSLKDALNGANIGVIPINSNNNDGINALINSSDDVTNIINNNNDINNIIDGNNEINSIINGNNDIGSNNAIDALVESDINSDIANVQPTAEVIHNVASDDVNATVTSDEDVINAGAVENSAASSDK